MFTLHDTIELTKKIIIFIVIGAVVIFVLYLLFLFGVFLKNTFYPTPPPAAKVGFGQLPPIAFGESEAGTYSYTIDTLTGALPVMQDRANVYEITQETPEFFDLSRMRSKAHMLNFTGSGEKIEENLYKFTGDDDLQRVFIINALTNNFILTSSYLNYPPLLDGSITTDVDSAEKNAREFFIKVNSFPATINTASSSARSLTIQDGNLVEATSLASTRLVRVDYYYQTVDTLPIRFPDYPDSLVYAIVTGNDRAATIVEASFVSKNISETFSDYPIKTTEEAFAELQKGNGYIATYYGKNNTIKINNVQLAYFMSREKQEYLMPIFVFSGNDGYVGYISAVEENLLKK